MRPGSINGPVPPATLAIGVFVAAVTLRPPIVAIGPLAPRMAQDLGVGFAWPGLITTASIVLMGLASSLGPRMLERLGFRVSVSERRPFAVIAVRQVFQQ